MKAIAMEFGLDVRAGIVWKRFRPSANFCSTRLRPGKETVLIIDEAQNLTEDLLEQIRLISNIETDDRKLLQIVLLGQPELRDRLNSPRLKQLRQRITVRFHLAPLTRVEVGPVHPAPARRFPGAQGRPVFTMPAVWRIFNYSGGIPRLVNAVCDKALLASFVRRSNHDHLLDGWPRHPGTGREHPRMSLINDALKRAKEAQRKETPSGGSPLWPVETNKRTERDFGLVLPVVIFFLVVAAIIFIGLAMARPQNPRYKEYCRPGNRPDAGGHHCRAGSESADARPAGLAPLVSDPHRPRRSRCDQPCRRQRGGIQAGPNPGHRLWPGTFVGGRQRQNGLCRR